MINSVTLVGRMTRDPELRYTNNGTEVCDFSIAVNKPWDKDNADFFDVTCWRGLAETVSKYCNKGSQVAIEGRLQQERWEKEGQKRSKVSVVANQVEFLDTKTESTDDDFSDVPF